MSWSYIRPSATGEERVGPISDDEFRHLINKGEIKPRTLVFPSRSKVREWMPAKKTEFFKVVLFENKVFESEVSVQQEKEPQSSTTGDNKSKKSKKPLIFVAAGIAGVLIVTTLIVALVPDDQVASDGDAADSIAIESGDGGVDVNDKKQTAADTIDFSTLAPDKYEQYLVFEKNSEIDIDGPWIQWAEAHWAVKTGWSFLCSETALGKQHDTSWGELRDYLDLFVGYLAIDGNVGLEGWSLREMTTLAVVTLQLEPLLHSSGTGSTETFSFVVGKKRFIPIDWESEYSIVVSVIDTKTGKEIHPLIIVGESGSTRNLWIDHGRYHLKIDTIGKWEITLYRNSGQKQFIGTPEGRAFYDAMRGKHE